MSRGTVRRVAVSEIFGSEIITAVTGKHIRALVCVYDTEFFNGEVTGKAKEVGIDFIYHAVRIPVVGVVSKRAEGAYVMEINPLLLKTACSASLSAIDCLMMVVENLLIHVIMILWGHTSNPRLYNALLDRYFGEDRYMKTYVQTELPPTGMLQWSNNSCYLDSLLTILFFEQSGTWKDIIQTTDVAQLEYRVQGICDVAGGSEINTPAKVREHAIAIQRQLLTDYKRLETGEEFVCSTLRTLLYRCFPDMKRMGLWTVYNVAAIYDLITEFFPAMKTNFYQSTVSWDGEIRTETTPSEQSRSTFAMSDFVFEYDTRDTHPEIHWNGITSASIVFYNGGEKLIEGVFGETILDGRYSLVGLVTLVDRIHYISYIKIGGIWYEYNDTRGTTRVVVLPESGVWREERGRMPSMYFYTRVKPTTTLDSTMESTNDDTRLDDGSGGADGE